MKQGCLAIKEKCFASYMLLVNLLLQKKEDKLKKNKKKKTS